MGEHLTKDANDFSDNISEKGSPVNADKVLIEDSEASGVKKYAEVGNLPGGGGGGSVIETLIFIIDGGGGAITTGIKGDLRIPFSCTINRVTLLADQSGSIVIDIWKDTYANFPPTVADTITAAAKPTISGAIKDEDSTLTGWTTAITADDILRFNVDSIATIERLTIALKVTRT